MAKRKKKVGKRSVEKKKPTRGEKPRSPGELEGLRRSAEAERVKLDRAEGEARELREKARALLTGARRAYGDAVARYRAVCRRAGLKCEFAGTRRGSVTERVSFLVEKTPKGVRVMIKGRPETAEVIGFKELDDSIARAAYGYTERHLGPREEIGNKGGSLSNRLRALRPTGSPGC